MSAYLCDDNHVIQLAAYLVAAGRRSDLGWIGRQVECPDDGSPPDQIKIANHIANELLAENYRSLEARYGDEDGPHQVKVSYQDIQMMHFFDSAKIAKSVSCYEYQACECSDWAESLAFRICQLINKKALERLPGYEDANWGAPLESRVPKGWEVAG